MPYPGFGSGCDLFRAKMGLFPGCSGDVNCSFLTVQKYDLVAGEEVGSDRDL